MAENSQAPPVEAQTHTTPQFRLAGIGTRFIAYLIDKLIQIGIVCGLLLIALLLLVFTGKLSSLAAFFAELRDSLGWWLIALIILTYEILTKGYFIFFEYLWNGATPGKRSQEIRVVRKDGQPISFLAALIRNLLRVVDIVADLYPLGLIVMFIDRRNRRVGDLAAGTLVVREAELGPSAACAPSEEPGIADDEVFNVALEMTAEDYDLVRKFLVRRDTLEPDHREDLARQILDRVSRRSVSTGGHLSDPEAFLEKLETCCRRPR
jgi:uncharacterized RDD family membrane protein YckC